MKTAINIALILVSIGLTVLLIYSIKDPIEFKSFQSTREFDVREHLKDCARAQIAFKAIKERYAKTWDELEGTLSTDSFKISTEEMDPTDPKGERIIRKFSYVAAKDSVVNMLKQVKDISKLKYVPHTDNVVFDIAADTLTSNKDLIHVFEVKTKVGNYMGKYASDHYKMFDPTYDPKGERKVGDMYKQTTAGNWK